MIGAMAAVTTPSSAVFRAAARRFGTVVPSAIVSSDHATSCATGRTNTTSRRQARGGRRKPAAPAAEAARLDGVAARERLVVAGPAAQQALDRDEDERQREQDRGELQAPPPRRTHRSTPGRSRS